MNVDVPSVGQPTVHHTTPGRVPPDRVPPDRVGGSPSVADVVASVADAVIDLRDSPPPVVGSATGAPVVPQRRRRRPPARRAVLRQPGRVEFYSSGPFGWKWIVKSKQGRVIVDAASGRQRRSDAELDASDVLEALLHSELPFVRLTVARYLAELSAEVRDGVVANAAEIAQSEQGNVANARFAGGTRGRV